MPTHVESHGRLITLPFELGQTVYMRIVADHDPGMITGICLNPDGVCYLVTWRNRQETRHFAIELTAEYIPDFSQD